MAEVQANTVLKRGRGRPKKERPAEPSPLVPMPPCSKYDPSLCDSLLSVCHKAWEQGIILNKTKIARLLGIQHRTFYLWLKEHEEFALALKEGWHDVEDTWHDLGIKIARGQIKGNSTAFQFMAGHAMGWKVNSESSGSKTVHIANMNVLDVKSMTTDQLQKFIADKQTTTEDSQKVLDIIPEDVVESGPTESDCVSADCTSSTTFTQESSQSLVQCQASPSLDSEE